MTLYKPKPGLADPVAFTNTMTALDAATLAVLGAGVVRGLTVDGTGTLQTGEALIGHLVTLAATVSVPAHPQAVGAATNYVYLAPGTATPNADGTDPGQVLVNQTGQAPAGSVLLATVVLGAGTPPAFVSASNAPAGRVQLQLPISLGNRWRGAYNPATAYNPGDEVSYGGSSSICVLACTGVLPTDGTHWNLLAAAGANGAPGPSLYNWRGTYDPAATYAVNDVVSYSGSSYVAIAPGSGNAPTNGTYWALLAQAGTAGPQGVPGATGAPGAPAYTFRGAYDAGTIYAVNDVVTSGGSSYVCLVAGSGYSPSDPTKWGLLAQAGAQGAQGVQGSQGIQGPQGVPGPAGLRWRGAYNAGTAYAANDAVSYQGASYIALGATTGNAPPNATYWGVLASAPKRLWQVVFHQPAATGLNLGEVVEAPPDLGGASVTWAPIQAIARVATAAAGETGGQLYAGATGNAAFGAGTSLMTADAAVSGAGNYRATSTAFTASTIATGTPLALNWSGVAGTAGTVTVIFQEQ